MPINRGTRHKPIWAGHVRYKGQRKCVGSFDNMEDWRNERARCLAELREEVDNPASSTAPPPVPTVLEFARAEIHENGRITMEWPDGERAQKDTGRRDSSIRRLRDGLRPFIREFHDRPLDSFTATRR